MIYYEFLEKKISFWLKLFVEQMPRMKHTVDDATGV